MTNILIATMDDIICKSSKSTIKGEQNVLIILKIYNGLTSISD